MGRGRTIPLSLPRRLVCDLVHFAHQVPTVPVQRTMRIAQLQALRAELTTRPSWCALFTKAYALLARTCPELRRTYLSIPTPHFYEHPVSVAAVTAGVFSSLGVAGADINLYGDGQSASRIAQSLSD